MYISKTTYDQMILQCQNKWPSEACGLVTGVDHTTILKVWPLENEWKSNVRFFVSKKSVEKVLAEISHLGQKVLGIYHSHPTTAPFPSHFDIKYHPDEQVKMIIISYKTSPPLTKCFTIHSNGYDEHPFFVEPS